MSSNQTNDTLTLVREAAVVVLNERQQLINTMARFFKREPYVSHEVHMTASDTFRLLINGKVHPLFVGFQTKQDAASSISIILEAIEIVNGDNK